MNPLRSVFAVLGGLILFGAVSSVMVWLTGGAPAAYSGLPSATLARLLAVQGLAGLLAGYIAARVAGRDERQHGLTLSGLYCGLMIWSFVVTPEAAQVPRWIQVSTVATVGIAMLAGSAVRARARSVQSDGAAAARPGERS
jgi:hypothetical protein